MKKTLFLSFLVFGVTVFSGCSLFNNGSGLAPEVVLPKDADIAFAVDYSDENSVEKFENILERFPDFGVKKNFIDGFNANAKEGLKYEDTLGPILDGKWEVVVGGKFHEGIDFLNLNNLDLNSIDLFMVLYTSEEDSLRKLIIDEMALDESMTYKEDGDFEYWFGPDDIYLVHYKDLFFVTNGQENYDAVVSRIKIGSGGFDSNESFISKNSGRSDLGYIYAKMDFISQLLVSVYAPSSLNEVTYGLADAMSVFYGDFTVDEDNFDFLADIKFENYDGSMLPKYKVDLVNKVPADGEVFYIESYNLKVYFQIVASAISAFGQTSGLELYLDEANLGSLYAVFSDELLNTISSSIGVSKEDLDILLMNSFAFSFSYPADFDARAGLYISLKDLDVDAAKRVVAAVDKYLDEVLKEMDIETQGVLGKVFKKEIVTIAGGGVHKISVDWGAVPAEMKSSFRVVPEFDIEKLDPAIYYGVTGDNVLVFVFYPDFENAYGENTLAKDEVFSGAISRLGDAYGVDLFYVNFDPLLKMFDVGYEFVKSSGGASLSRNETSEFELMRRICSVFKYVVMSESFSSDKYVLGASVGFNKVDLENASDIDKVDEEE